MPDLSRGRFLENGFIIRINRFNKNSSVSLSKLRNYKFLAVFVRVGITFTL